MNLLFLCLYIFLGLLMGLCIFIIVKIYNMEEFYSSTYNKHFAEQNSGFLGKIDLIFNRIMQSKEEDQKRMFYTLDPISKTIDSLKIKMDEIEKNRIIFDKNFLHSIENIKELQKEVKDQTILLKDETGRIMSAFKNPNARGNWGEVHLKRTVEIAGMIPYCDFETQVEMGESRPDMVVKLPNGGIIIVDAKTPMEAFLKFFEGGEEEKFKKENIDAFKKIIKALGDKKYWVNGKTPEFVVMYVPTESLWLTALSIDNSLFDFASERNVIIATPTTLLSLLKTIFYGWSQLKLAEETEDLKRKLIDFRNYINQLGKTTHDIVRNFHQCGKNLSILSQLIEKTKKYIDISSLNSNSEQQKEEEEVDIEKELN